MLNKTSELVRWQSNINIDELKEFIDGANLIGAHRLVAFLEDIQMIPIVGSELDDFLYEEE